jgi:hypothetical protein
MQPIELYLEVRRGKEVLLKMGAVPGGPSAWSAISPLADIQTPQGPMCEILLLSSIRGKDWTLAPATDEDWDMEAW